jgi:hypothetical protein
MTNRAGSVDCYNHHSIATIPDKQVDTLKFMLYNSDTPVTINSLPLKLGSKVRVIRGKLCGLEGYLHNYSEGNAYVCVYLDFLGYAKVSIKATDISNC